MASDLVALEQGPSAPSVASAVFQGCIEDFTPWSSREMILW
jgi:hypothetical protein